MHRVVLSHPVYRALQAEALVKESSLQDTMNRLILDNLSREASKIIDDLSRESIELLDAIADDALKAHEDIDDTKPSSHVSTSTSKKKQLVKNEAAVARIKELWSSTNMTVVDISKEIGGKRSTVGALIERLIERGELAQRAK